MANMLQIPTMSSQLRRLLMPPSKGRVFPAVAGIWKEARGQRTTHPVNGQLRQSFLTTTRIHPAIQRRIDATTSTQAREMGQRRKTGRHEAVSDSLQKH
jgi:hypothetical protein